MWKKGTTGSSAKVSWNESWAEPYFLGDNNENEIHSLDVENLFSGFSKRDALEFCRNICNGLLMKLNVENQKKESKILMKLTGDQGESTIIPISGSDTERGVFQKKLSKEIDLKGSVTSEPMSDHKLDEDVLSSPEEPLEGSWTPYYGMRRSNSLRRKPLQRSSSLPTKSKTYDNLSFQLERQRTLKLRSKTIDIVMEKDEHHGKYQKDMDSSFENKAFEDNTTSSAASTFSKEENFSRDPLGVRSKPVLLEKSHEYCTSKTEESWRPYKEMQQGNRIKTSGRNGNGNASSRRGNHFHLFGYRQGIQLSRSPTFTPGIGCGFLEYPYSDGGTMNKRSL